MDNLIFSEVEMIAKENRDYDLYVKSFVTVKAKSKTDDKIIELRLKAYTKVDYSAFQQIGIENNWIKLKDNNQYIHIKDVETRLYIGKNRYNNDFHMPGLTDDIERIEEERNLFYVACTRAKTYLHITVPLKDMDGKTTLKQSPFVNELLERQKNEEKLSNEGLPF